MRLSAELGQQITSKDDWNMPDKVGLDLLDYIKGLSWPQKPGKPRKPCRA